MIEGWDSAFSVDFSFYSLPTGKSTFFFHTCKPAATIDKSNFEGNTNKTVHGHMKGDQMSIMEKTRGQKNRKGERLIALALSTILSEIKGPGYMESCGVQPLTGLCHPIHLPWSWCLYFSFKLVLELGYKREGELCPLVTLNQKENRIPLWALLCKLWHRICSLPKRTSSSVWLCWEVHMEPVSLLCGRCSHGLSHPHLYLPGKSQVGACFLISWPLLTTAITEAGILSWSVDKLELSVAWVAFLVDIVT